MSHFEVCGRCHSHICVCVDDEPMVESRFALPCIVCGKPLLSASELNPTNQPEGGLCFHTAGHYGSTAFDRPEGGELQISVCDECIVQRAKSGHVLRVVEKRQEPDLEVEFWRSER